MADNSANSNDEEYSGEKKKKKVVINPKGLLSVVAERNRKLREAAGLPPLKE